MFEKLGVVVVVYWGIGVCIGCVIVGVVSLSLLTRVNKCLQRARARIYGKCYVQCTFSCCHIQ